MGKIAFPRTMRNLDPGKLSSALAENMRYLENVLNQTFNFDHAALSNVGIDDHHVKYTDAAVDAIVATHAAIVAAHHAKYLDSEAVTAMGVKGDSNPLHHDKESIAALVGHRITTAQTITTSSGTDVIFNSLVQEDDADAHIALNTSTGVITMNTTGWYHLESTITWDVDTTGRRLLTIQSSADGEVGGSEMVPGTSANRQQVSAIFPATAADTVTVEAYHTKGSDLDILAGIFTNVAIHKLN